MSNSLLNSLPALHGTMLSIIVGFVTAFALYAYQTTSSARQRLEAMKRQVQNISRPDFQFFTIDRSAYLNSAGEINWKRCRDGLWDATMLSWRLNNEDAVNFEKTQIEKAALETLGILTLVMNSYPYFGQGELNKPDSDETTSYRLWLDDLSLHNGYFNWIWNSYHRGLSELMNQHRALVIQRKKDKNEKALQQMLDSRKEQGVDVSVEEIQWMKKQFPPIREVDYDLMLRDFFSKVNQIEQQIIPKAKENLITLTTYENQFKLKTRTIWVLVSAVFIFVLGIITPIVITAYAKAPIVKSLEICLLIVTTAPYLI